MTRPTSLCRSCNRNIVVLPLGISVSIISSGYSTNCRMINSRNSLMTEKLTTNPPSHNTTARQVNESTRISARIKKQAFDTNVSTPLVAVDRRYRSQSWLEVPDGGGASSCVDCEVPRSDWEDESLDACAFLVFLIKLRTVSDACAPLLIQYSARSSFNALL
jgi:hypothetical protein